ncbi:MAG: alpha/beta fold hydrolase [Acidobacteriota bacterium]
MRRRRLVRGLLMGGAAIGVPALINALVSKRAGKLRSLTWGQGESFAFKHGKISFQRLGEGPPVLLLHSLGPGHSAEEWRQTAERLAASYEVFAPDLLGWGRSEKPALTYDGELYIELVADFAKRVVGTPVAVVAAGLPAAYAVQLAVDQTEIFRALALVVPTGIELHGDEPDFKDAMVHRMLRLPILGTSALNLYTSRSAISNYLRREVYARPEGVDSSLIDQHYRSSHQPGAHNALAAYLSGYLNHGVREILNRVEVPVWLGWGRRAASPAVESADLWLQQLDNAELEVFESSGLLPHAETSVEFSQRLNSFLSDLGG